VPYALVATTDPQRVQARDSANSQRKPAWPESPLCRAAAADTGSRP